MASGQACLRRYGQKVRLERKRKGLCSHCGKRKRQDGLITCRICRKEYKRKMRKKMKLTDFEKKQKEQFKNYIFDIIEEYFDLKHKRFRIKFAKKDKMKGFGIIMQEDFSSIKKDIFVINGTTKRKLDKTKIKYNVLI